MGTLLTGVAPLVVAMAVFVPKGDSAMGSDGEKNGLD
jgi:hypothetical protein